MRDDFSEPIKNALAKRAAYICSNPDCRRLTVAPSSTDESKLLYIGCAAHITAASPGGPRFDSSLSPSQRNAASNGIYLCRSCGDLIDKNSGSDFEANVLHTWKKKHEAWISDNLNKEFGGSIFESIDELRSSIANVVNQGDQVKSTLDRNFELHKQLKKIASAIELFESVDYTTLNSFAFLVHIHCIGIGQNNSFLIGNMYPSDSGGRIKIGSQEMPPSPIEAGWSTNPALILSQIATYRGTRKRKYFTVEIRANNHSGLERTIDVEQAQIEFYLSSELSPLVKKFYLIVNDLIVEEFEPSALEVFPATTNLKSPLFRIPPEIANRLPSEVLELKLIRYGRKLFKGNKSQDTDSSVEPTWFLKYPNELRKVNALEDLL